MDKSKTYMKNQIKKQIKHTIEKSRLELLTINGR